MIVSVILNKDVYERCPIPNSSEIERARARANIFYKSLFYFKIGLNIYW